MALSPSLFGIIVSPKLELCSSILSRFQTKRFNRPQNPHSSAPKREKKLQKAVFYSLSDKMCTFFPQNGSKTLFFTFSSSKIDKTRERITCKQGL